MAKSVKIPDNMSPWKAIINGIEYVYPAGTTQEVPDDVAAFIERISKVEPKKEPVLPPFIPSGGGGGSTPSGGVTSWNDLTDKPFYATVETVEVMSEQNVTCRSEEDDPCRYNIGWYPEAGKKYRVYFNGEEYICDVREGEYVTSDDGGYACWIGNASFRDGRLLPSEDTGEPFLIDSHADAIWWSKDLGETITIQVTEVKETVKTLDPKYLPSGGGGGDVCSVMVTDVWAWDDEKEEDVQTVFCSKTYQELAKAWENRIPIIGCYTIAAGGDPDAFYPFRVVRHNGPSFQFETEPAMIFVYEDECFVGSME